MKTPCCPAEIWKSFSEKDIWMGACAALKPKYISTDGAAGERAEIV